MARQAEVFEIRTLLSGITFVVNTMNDTVDNNIGNGAAADAAGDTSLRAAIQEANATSDDVTIVLPAGTFSLSLSGAGEDAAASGDLDITNATHSIRVRGVGESGTTIDGVGLDRVFDVALGADFTLTDVTVTGGSVANDGGGLRANGFVTISRSTFSSNATTASGVGTGGGAVSVGSSGDVSIFGSVFASNSSNADSGGGAILNNGRVFVDGTTFDSNVAGPNTQAAGGAIRNAAGDLTVDRSLFDSNTAAGNGGAIVNDVGTVFVANSTFDGNTSGQTGGAVYENGSVSGSTRLQSVTITQNTATVGTGGVSQNSGTVFVQNSVIAGNTGSATDDVGEISGGAFVSFGNNFIGERDGTTGFIDGVNGDQVGTAASPKDPQLGTLADNSGPTLTRAPLPASPLIDMGAVPPVISPITFFASDQRGATRQSGGAVDIGAVETGFTGFFVTTQADTPDANPGDSKPEDAAGNVSLRSVVQHVNGGEDIGAVVVLSPEVYSLTRIGFDDTSLNGDLDVQNNMRFSGFGSLATAIDGEGLNRVFHVLFGAPIFNDLTLRNGNAAGDPFDAGGALLNISGAVTLTGVAVRDSSAANGGGVYSGGTTTIEGSTIAGNSAATSGGGLVVSFGTATIRESFFVNNSAGVSAGGIGVSGDVNISSTTIRDNVSLGQAGGIGLQTSGMLTLTDTAIRSNSATTDGGGIGSEGFLTIYGGVISQNTAGTTGAGIGAQIGSLTLVGTQVDQNVATGDGGGLALAAGITSDIRFADFGGNTAANGGGIANTGGTLSLFGVTIAGGNATAGAGLTQLSGSTTITNSTISGNTATGPGGGIYNGSGFLNVQSSTISQNAAATGGGIQLGNGGAATVGNSIVAGNTATMSDADVSANFGGATSNGFNLIGAGGPGFMPGINNDVVGTSGAPINAMLDPLQDNGGGTRTHALLAGSPAIDAGDNTATTLVTDQRGAPRQLNGGTSLTVDIGAFENGFTGFFVDTTEDTVDANPGNGVAEDAQGNTSLRAAIQEANALAGAQTIVLPAGTYALTLFGVDEDAAVSGDLDITDDLTIQGQGFDATRIDGLQQDRVFDIDQKTVTLNDLQIANGDTTGQTNDEGGGLRTVESSLTLNRVEFRDNLTPDRGGAIFDLKFGPPATLIVNDSHFINSQAAQGGAIYVINDVLDINDSLIENSQATTGSGGAIHSRDGQVTITGSEIRMSAALSGAGGAIFSDKQGGGFGPGSVTVVDSRITNSQADSGGAIHGNGDALTISGSEITFSFAGTGNGGAIENIGGDLVITESLIEMNQTGGSSAVGGGIATSGAGSTLTVTDSTISNNNAGIGLGGGIYSDSISQISGTTIVNNFADSGGGIRNHGSLTIQNSTISGNLATGGQPYGGGLYAKGGSTTTVESTTITNNTGYGGGIYAGDSSTVNLKNTIIAGNNDPVAGIADIAGSVNSNGNNILGDTAGSSGLLDGVNDDIVGGETSVAISNATNAGPIQVTAAGHGLLTGDRVRIDGVAGNEAANGIFIITFVDANNFTLDGSFGSGTYVTGGNVTGLVNPLLGPLAVNLPPEPMGAQAPAQGVSLPGPGPEFTPMAEVETSTHILLPGSVAIDAGNNSGAPAIDQRGLPRPIDGDGNMTATVDIGAIELFFGSASGIVFDDLNGNGIRDMGEPGISGVNVFHDASENGIPDPGEQSIFTFFDDPGTMGVDETGTFILNQIPPGSALIRHELMPGFRLTTPSNPLLSVPQSVGSVTDPGDSIAVDLDNDGNLDAVATRPTANEVVVSFGDGNGAFSAPMALPVGTNPVAVDAEDFNFDGQLDLVVANRDSNDVSVLLNIGGGMFSSAINIAVGMAPQAILHGDFNGDMNQDVAVANGVSDSVTVLTGDGMGGFGMLPPISVGDNPSGIASFDWNGDGVLELATVNRDDATVTVIEFVNGAVNTFSSSTTVTQPTHVASADINHDGLEDLAIVGATGDVRYRLSLGTSLDSDISIGTVANPSDVVAADFNGTGFAGIAVSSDSASGLVTVFENVNGALLPGVAFPTGSNPQAIDAVDTNFDGLPDLFTANSGSDDFSALINVTGSSAVTVATNATTAGVEFGREQLGSITGTKFLDENRNGIKDPTENGLANVTVFLDSNANGRRDPFEQTTVTQPDDPGTAGVDETGNYEFLDVIPGEHRVIEEVPVGFLQTFPGGPEFDVDVVAMTGGSGVDIVQVDFTGDGILDFVVLSDEISSGTLRSFRGNGAGGFNFNGLVSVGSFPDDLVVGNLDGDSLPDLVVSNSGDNTLQVFELQTNGTFSSQGTLGTPADPRTVRLADVDGDMASDIVVANFGSPAGVQAVSVFTNNGGFTFSAPTHVNTGGAVLGFDLADLDHDGDVDLVAANSDRDEFKIFRNDAGTFVEQLTVSTGNNPVAVAIRPLTDAGLSDILIGAAGASPAIHVHLASDFFQYPAGGNSISTTGNPDELTLADFDENGELDIATTDTGRGEVAVLAGMGGGMFAPGIGFFVGSQPSGLAVGDADNDGRPDLLVAGGTSATFSVLYNRIGTHRVFVNSGLPAAGVDFGNVELATISGTKFHDLDQDGVHDMGEPGLPGFTIYIDDNENGRLDPGEVSTITDEDGLFTIAGVEPVQAVRVREVQQPGFVQTEPNSFVLDVPLSIPVNGGSRSFNIGDVIASGDFDGDGLAEIVSANPTANSVSVVGFEGAGIPVRVDLGVGLTPLTVRVADLNADGNLDIVTANNGSDNVSVILGNGDGTFQAGSEFPAGTRPQSLTIADVDGGGTPDVVVSSDSSSNLQVLSNNGMGALALPGAVPVAGVSSVEDIESGDFDMDGDVDLAVVSAVQNRVSILLNAGGGTFGAASAVGVGNSPLGTAIGDFDEDGDLDLAVTNTSDSTVQFLINDGAGTFLPGAATAVGGSPEAVVVGDVNNDGNLDVVVANQVQTDVSILLGDGMGGVLLIAGTVGASQDGVALDDLNGDGRLDILAETFGQGSVTTLLNLTGTRIVTPSSGEMITGVDFGNFALPGEISGTKYHDLNENGVRDMGEPGLIGFTIFIDLDNDDVFDAGEPMTVTGADGSFTFTGVNPLQNYTVSELQQPGFVQLAPTSPGLAFSGDVGAGGEAAAIVTGDFDGQFGEDMAVTLESSNQVAVLLRQANGMFGMPTLIGVGAQPFAIVAADFDGANGLDLAVANEADSTVTILSNNGNGVFTPQSPLAVANFPSDLAVADVDGVNGPDLVVANNSNNSFQVALNDGMGSLAAQAPVGAGVAPSSVAVADYDGDGDQDVALTTAGDNRLTVFLQTSPLSFVGQAPIVTGTDPSRLRSADLNGDFVPDLVVVNQQSGDVTVVLNNSSGGTLNLAPPANFPVGVAGESLALVDLNRDGVPEIIVTGEDDEQLSVLNNNGLGGFSPPVLSPLDGTFPVEVAPIQLNADGDTDLVLTDAEFGEIVLLTSTVGSHSVFVGAGATVSGLDFGNREINDPPIVTAPATAVINEDSSLLFGMNAISISDPDAGANNVEVVLTATNGTATLSQTTGLMFSSGANGTSAMTFTGTISNINLALNGLGFAPTLNFNGAAFLNVSVDDQGNTGFGGPQFDSAQVAITVNAVNDAPVLTVPGGVSLNEDGSLVLGTISFTDADIGAGNAEVTLSVSNGALTLPSTMGLSFSMGGNGSSSMTFSGSLGNVNTAINGITYAPNPDFNGADTLSVSVSDLGNSGGPAQMDSGVVSLTVNPINDAPVAVVPGTQSATEDTSKLINGLSVVDVDAAGNDVRATLSAGNGTVTVDASVTGGVQAGDITGNGTSSVVLSGTVSEINLTLGVGITYLGNLNFAGTDSITLLIEDLGSTGETPVNPLSDSDSFDVTVAAVNDPPVLSGIPVPVLDYTENDVATVLASTAAVADVDDTQLASATVDFTANFQTTEDVLTANVSGTSISLSFNSGTGVLLLSGPDTLANFQQVLRTVTYQNTSEDPSQLRRTVRFVLNDGSTTSVPQLRDIDVTSVNDAPTFDSQATSFVLAEHSVAGTAVHTVLASDVDSPAFLTFSIVGGNTGNAFAINSVTGQITISDPNAVDFEGVGSFNLNVRVTDANPITPTPLSADQTFTINLTDIAEPFFVGPGAFSSGAVTLVRDGAFLHARLTGTMTDAVPKAAFANVTNVFVQGRDGASDELTIDFSGGDPVPTGGSFYDGGSGAGTDSLVLTGGSATTINHTLLNANSGNIDVDGDSIGYDGLEPVSDQLVAVNRAFFYGSGSDTVTLSDGVASADGQSRLSSPTAETVDFRNPTGALLISLGDGNDVFRATSTDSGLDASVSILGEVGDDDISAMGFTAGGVTIDGGDDNDVLGGSPGQDDVMGGNGNDQFLSSPGDDMMDGGPGNDFFNDEIDDGNDSFTGGGGFDSVFLGSIANQVEIDVNGADSGVLTAVSAMGSSTTTFTGTETAAVDTAVQQNLTVDYSALATATNITLAEGEGFSLTGTGLVNVLFSTINQNLVIDGSRGDDTISIIGLSAFDAGLDIRGGTGVDRVVVPGGLPTGGLDSDIIFATETSDISGLLKSNGGQVQLDGLVTLLGNATIDATTTIFGDGVMTGPSTLTVEGDSQLNGSTLPIFDGTFQLNGNLSSSMSIVIQGPTFNVTGDAVFLGRVTQNGTTTIGGEATFSAPLQVGGTINGGSDTFRLHSDTQLDGGTINTGGLIEVGINPMGQGAPPVLAGDGSVSSNNLLILDGAILAPTPFIQTTATQLQAGATLDVSDLNKGQPPTATLLRTSDSLDLGGADLFRLESDSLPFVSQLIIDKTSEGPITGTFNGLAEGTAFDVTTLDDTGPGPALPSGTRRYAITYQGGDGNDVVIFPVASVSGLVFADNSSENGIREDLTEARVQGVTVDLLDDQGSPIDQTTTAIDGTYSFADLLPGNYRVRFIAPNSQHFADRNAGIDDTIDSDPNVLTGEALVPNLLGGEDRGNVDAGLVDTTISIGDPAPINEGNGNPVSILAFEVTLNGRSPHQVTVNAQIAQGVDGQEVNVATIGNDVLAFTSPAGLLPVVFNPGQTSQIVTVPIVGDLNLEQDEGFEVRLSNPVQATLADGVGFGLIRNDDFAAPTVVFGDDATIIEGQFPSEPLLELTINLEGGTVGEDLFISYNTVELPIELQPGDAESGFDFRAVDDVAVIPAGLSSVTIQIPVIGDSILELDETFDVELTDITGGEMQGVSFGGRTIARGTIVNDDVFVPEVSIGDAFVSERNSPAFSTLLFPVTLSGPASTDTRIAFSTTQLSGDGTATEGLDYLPAGAEPLFIPQGQVSGTIPVTILGDQLDEDDEVFALELGDILEGNVTIDEGLAVGTIGDDDDPILLASLDSEVSVSEGPDGSFTSFTMTLTLSGDALVPVDFLVSTLPPDAMAVNAATPGLDFVSFTDRPVRVEAGRRTAMFNVDVLGDALFEADEILLTQITGTAPGTPPNIVIDAPRSTATGTILDDDAPTPIASIDAEAFTTETRPGLTTVVSIPVRLSAPSMQPVTVDFETVPSVPGVGIASDVDDPMTPGREDDFRARSDTLTFAPGQQLRFIQILVNGDDLVEPPETLAVDLTGISANAELDPIATRNVSTIFDDDVAIPFVSIAESATAMEPDGDGVTPVDLTVTLSGRLSQDVVVGYSIPEVTTPGAATPVEDFVPVARNEVTIEAGLTSATITVLVSGDDIAENVEHFFVQLLDVAPLPDGTVIAQLDQQRQQSEITIDDNDAAVPTVMISDATVFEGDPAAADGVAPVDDPRLDFTISLSSVPTGPVSVEVETVRFEDATPGVANTDGPNRDVFATRRILFFDATITSQIFSVRVEPDFEFEADEAVFVNVSNSIGAIIPAGSLQGVGTVLNDDFDRPTVSISSVSLLEGDMPGENVAALRVTLDADPAQGTIPDVSVGFRTLPITATADVDYTPVEGVLTFADGAASQTIEIPILGDLDNEGPEEFFVELFDLDDGIQDIELNREAFQGIVQIVNDDAPDVRFQIDNVRQREGTGGASEFVFTVRRTGNSAQPSTVQFATSAGTAEAGDDFVGRSGTLTFAADGPDTQTITISVVGDDQLEEEFETFFVTLNNPTNATVAAAAGQGTGTILDDDQRVFSADANAALEEIVRELRERFAGAPLDDPTVTAFFEQELREFAAEFGPILGIILDPVDFLLTDLESRTVGYTESDGEVSEVPRAFYSGDGDVELVVIPAAEQGVYGLQLSGVDTGEFRSTATLVTSEGFTKTISNVDVLSGDVELALDFTEEDALPLRNEVIQELADRQEPTQQPVQNDDNLAIAEDVAAAINDVVLPDDLTVEPPPPEESPGPFDPWLDPFEDLIRGLGESLANQMDPLPDLTPADPNTEQLLDEVYSGLGQQAFGAPGDLLLDLIDLLSDFGEDDSESEGDAEATDGNEDESKPEADDGNAALDRLFESRRIAKAQREALLWMEKRRQAEADDESQPETKDAPSSRPATAEPRAEANSPAATTASVKRNPDSRAAADSEEIPEEEA